MPPESKRKIDAAIASGPTSTLANRIVGHGEMSVARLKANPFNWRTHSEEQRATMKTLLDNVGWLQMVIYNRRTEHLIDGHLRVEIAAERGEKKIPVVIVDLSDEEERTVLATFDPAGDLAGMDEAKLAELLAGLHPEDAGLAKVIANLEAELGIGKEDAADVETLLDQAIQLESGKEFVVVVCEDEDEFVGLKVALGLKMVRRGGYKPDSPFDAKGTERVVRAGRLLALLKGKKR